MKTAVSILSFVLLVGQGLSQTASIPFVGCASDGQLGPQAAPQGKAISVRMSNDRAVQLAWYKSAEAPGVLAPRGWHCFGTYGSSGATLYVSPAPIDAGLVLSLNWKGFEGSAIEISSMNGGTSGRFEVARIIARLFPAYMRFTRSIIAEGIESAGNFPTGLYPHDKVTYKTKTLAYYETPPRTEGLGTQSWLRPSDDPIAGFVFLKMAPDEDPYDIFLRARLPADRAWLTEAIQSGTEQLLELSPKK